MYLDVLIATAGMLALFGLAFRLGRILTLRTRIAPNTSLAISLCLASLFAWSVGGDLRWAKLFGGAAFVWSNWTPLLVAVAAGIVSASMRARENSVALSGPLHPGDCPVWKTRGLVALGLLALLLPVAKGIGPLSQPITDAQWLDGVCLQSSQVSCAPAAAATLLRTHRINTDEKEMAAYCLTGRDGTTPLGLYRGLRAVTADHGLSPRLLPTRLEELDPERDFPALVLVELDLIEAGTPVLGSLVWERRNGHVIVVFGRDEKGYWQVADPAVGRARWSDERMRANWTGQAIQLRPSSALLASE